MGSNTAMNTWIKRKSIMKFLSSRVHLCLIFSTLFLGTFFRLTNGIPAFLDIRERVTKDGVRVPPLWVSYERPVSIPPHNSSKGRADLISFVSNGIYKIINRPAGATYTFGPWVPTQLTLRRGTNPPLHHILKNNQPGLSGILEISTSENIRPRIKKFSLSDALEYSFMLDHRFAIYIYLSILFTLWFISVPAPLALKPEVLFSNDLGFFLKVANDTFVYGVCSTHPQILSPCDCGEPLNNTVKLMLDVDNIYDDKGEYKQEIVNSALCKYFIIIVICLSLYESVSPDGFWVDTSSWF